jgi:hypothetical protein
MTMGPELSPEEQDRRLTDAARRFLLGEISADEFHRAKERYMPDYRAAMIELARRRRFYDAAQNRRQSV